MNEFIGRLITQIKTEKKSIGKIIDDRGANGLPKDAYVKEYEKLSELEKSVQEFAN